MQEDQPPPPPKGTREREKILLSHHPSILLRQRRRQKKSKIPPLRCCRRDFPPGDRRLDLEEVERGGEKSFLTVQFLFSPLLCAFALFETASKQGRAFHHILFSSACSGFSSFLSERHSSLSPHLTYSRVKPRRRRRGGGRPG